MRILHLSHTDIANDSRILKEMTSLHENGYQVAGLGVAGRTSGRKSTNDFDNEIHSVILRARRLSRLPRSLRHAFTLVELVAKMLPRAVGSRPDLVHCHDTLSLPIGALVKLLTRATLVYDAHELESDRAGLTRMHQTLALSTERALWPLVDALIVVSPSIWRWYEETLGPKCGEVILNSPTFPGSGRTAGNYFREKYSIAPQHRVFVYVGLLNRGRGLDLIAHAFTQPGRTSHVIFLGHGDLLKELQTTADEHENLHVHEPVPHADVVPMISSADVGICLVERVSLSDYYCLPNKLFEYCFAGLPVLASNFPDMREIVAEYNLGEVCDLDPTSVVQAIEMFERIEDRREFADLTPLTWRAQELKLLKLYAHLGRLGRKARRPPHAA